MTYVSGQQIGYFPEDFIHKDGRVEYVGPVQEEVQAYQNGLKVLSLDGCAQTDASGLF